MKRVLAWVVFAAVLVGFVKLVQATGNPWSLPSLTPPAFSPSAVVIPGCGDKTGCSF